MIANTYKQQYRAYASATLTVGKTQQIILLYEGIIKLLQQAKDAIREKRIEDRYNLVIKASTIIHGLQGCLDFENGKEIANVLYSFYSSIDNRLFSIHRDNSLEICDSVIEDLKQMRDAWIAVDEAEAAAAPVEQTLQPAAGVTDQPSTDKSDAVNIVLSA